MLPTEAWTQWAFLKCVVDGGRLTKEVAQGHAQTSEELCPHQSPSYMVSQRLHVYLKLQYIHILAGCCTATEALAIKMSFVLVLAHSLAPGSMGDVKWYILKHSGSFPGL